MIPNNNKTALIYAVDLLSRRAYSIKQLSDKLLRKGYSAEDTGAAIARLLERHYLDDCDLCCRQYNSYLREGRLSLTAIRFKLKEKGFSSQDMSFAAENTETDIQAYEANVCLKLLNQRYQPRNADKLKCQGYLYRKGFTATAIRAALTIFFNEA